MLKISFFYLIFDKRFMDYLFKVLFEIGEAIKAAAELIVEPSFLNKCVKYSCANVSRVVGSVIHSPLSLNNPSILLL